MNSEEWLRQAVDVFRPRFEGLNFPIPEALHVTVGFPHGAKSESKVILGQCWARCAAEDNVNNIFMSPVITDPVEELATLLHELVHAALDVEDGHTGRFRILATALGLEGQMKATVPSEKLRTELAEIAKNLGPWGRGRLDPQSGRFRIDPETGDKIPVVTGPKKQGTRYIKVMCPNVHEEDQDANGEGPRYTVRMTSVWLDQAPPVCGVCDSVMEEQE